VPFTRSLYAYTCGIGPSGSPIFVLHTCCASTLKT
jgi:hypothetical protein